MPRLKVRQVLEGYGKGVIAFAVCLGALAGVGVYTFGYGKGASYLSNNPQTSVNCHVMQDHFDAWQHSARILAESIDFNRQAQAASYRLLAKINATPPQ